MRLLPREQRIEVGVNALPATLEIGLAAGYLDLKPAFYDALLSYRLRPFAGDFPGADQISPDRFAPRLAESWTISEDGSTVTFRLRDGVFSPSGHELDAEDVVFTLRRGFHAPGYYKWTAEVGGLYDWQAVKALDRRTVQFDLAAPRPFFLDTRVIPLNGIFDRTAVEPHMTSDDPWALRFIAENAAGFGPYIPGDRIDGELMLLSAHRRYYRGEPAFKQVVYRVIADPDEQAARLAAGDIDFAQSLGPEQYARLADAPGVQLVQGQSTQSVQVSLNCREGAFVDVRLRQALAWTLPYDTILSDVFGTNATWWRSHIPAVVPGYQPETWPYAYRPETGAKLAAQVGPSERTLRILGNAGEAFHPALGAYVTSALERLGYRTVTELLPLPAYIQRRVATEYDVLLSGAKPQIADPGYALSHDYCSGSQGNDFGYSNPAVDENVEAGLRTMDPAVRAERYAAAAALLAADVPVIPIASVGFTEAFNRRIGGVAFYPSGFPRYGELFPAT